MSYSQKSEQVLVVKHKVEYTGTLDEIINLLNAIKSSTVFSGGEWRSVSLYRTLVDKERRSLYTGLDVDNDDR